MAVGLVLTASAQEPRTRGTGAVESAGLDTRRLDQAVQLYRDAVKNDDLRGVVLLVARTGTVLLHEAIGWRHRGYQLPMEKDTLFRMASNTKPVVAAAALMLVEQGTLSLDEPVAKKLPGFDNWRSRTITLRHLLTHSSGLRIEPIFLPFDEGDSPPTLREAADKFGRIGPEVEPGTTYSYNNPGYNTIGALIDIASGLPLEVFLRTHVYEPLGMTDTLNHEDPAKLHRMATVYRGRRDRAGRLTFVQGFTPDDAPDFPVVRASGGMISTASDYARFTRMFLNRGVHNGARVLSEASIRDATSRQVKVDESSWYGFGWSVDASGVYSHGGSDGTFAWVDPGRDLYGLVFTQSPGGQNPLAAFRQLVNEAVDVATTSAAR